MWGNETKLRVPKNRNRNEQKWKTKNKQKKKKLERLRNRNTEIKLCRKNDKMKNENDLNTKEIREN